LISAFPPAAFLNAAAQLSASAPAVKIQLSSPSFFGSEDSRRLREYRPFISDIQAPLGDGKFYVAKSFSSEHRKLLSAARENGQRALALLALAESTKADGLVSDATELLETRYALLAHHRIRVIPLEEFPRWIEVCGIGHSTFVSGRMGVGSVLMSMGLFHGAALGDSQLRPQIGATNPRAGHLPAVTRMPIRTK
jgi:hypothetical protein